MFHYVYEIFSILLSTPDLRRVIVELLQELDKPALAHYGPQKRLNIYGFIVTKQPLKHEVRPVQRVEVIVPFGDGRFVGKDAEYKGVNFFAATRRRDAIFVHIVVLKLDRMIRTLEISPCRVKNTPRYIIYRHVRRGVQVFEEVGHGHPHHSAGEGAPGIDPGNEFLHI